ncbi:Hypothetical predicted protein [Marmota monax]|uniref:Uncharacterized protein n=1 Tax=Marmota monax TaxID=9995 RepID=A0A5E4A9P2_MARMO|nr:Hypothetical predicted protein [Marmota monax]
MLQAANAKTHEHGSGWRDVDCPPAHTFGGSWAQAIVVGLLIASRTQAFPAFPKSLCDTNVIISPMLRMAKFLWVSHIGKEEPGFRSQEDSRDFALTVHNTALSLIEPHYLSNTTTSTCFLSLSTWHGDTCPRKSAQGSRGHRPLLPTEQSPPHPPKETPFSQEPRGFASPPRDL